MHLSKRRLCSSLAAAILLRSSSRLSSNLAPKSPIAASSLRISTWVPDKVGVRAELYARYYCGPPRGRCWNCGRRPSSGSEPFLVCGECRAVQPVDGSVDYFRILGIERGYTIKEERLDGRYKEWQKKLHPDLVHTKSEREKSYAAEQSARVIDAYRTLSKPLSRAMYLLELEGLRVDEEATISDLQLLTEVLEIREAVAEANTTKTLEKIRSEIQEKFDFCSSSFEKEFAKRDYHATADLIKRMTYYDKALHEINIKN